MWSFFHGWRRKAGVVTLVMALAMAAAWVRSCVVDDLIQIRLTPAVGCAPASEYTIVGLRRCWCVRWVARTSLRIFPSYLSRSDLQFLPVLVR